MNKRHHGLWIFVAGLALSGCRLGNPASPPALPPGQIDGYVVSGGPVAGASVTVTGAGGTLGATRTDDSGHFALDVQSLDATLEVTASGGSYVGAGGTNATSGVLRGVFPYQNGGAVQVAVDPLTTAMAAYDGYLQGQGVDLNDAAVRARAAFVDWLGFDPTTTQPVMPADAGTGTALTSGLRHGLVVAALTRFARENGSRTGTIAGLMASDLAFDGILDGVGASGPLKLGALPLSTAAYRQGIAQAFLQAAAATAPASPDALPGPNAAALLAYAQTLAQSPSPLFGTGPAPAFPGGGLSLSLSPWAAWTHGPITIAGTTSDPYGLPVAVTIAIDHTPYQTVTAAPAFAFLIDTSAFADGTHDLSVSAHDAAGESASYDGSLGVDNTPPQACLSVFQPTMQGIMLAGKWQDLSGVVAASADGVALSLFSAGTWEGVVPTPLPSPTTVTFVDAAGNEQNYSWVLDGQTNPAPCS